MAAHHWTLDEVRAMQDEDRVWPRFELIDGELIVTPPPPPVHEAATEELVRLLDEHVRARGIGVVETSPADIELAPESIIQPDVFVTPLVGGRPPVSWAETTVLLLAVEVTCAPSQRVDRLIKRRFYSRVGVPEYWMVDLDAQVIERTVGRDPRPEIIDRSLAWQADASGTPLVVDVAAYFARLFKQAAGV